MTFGAAAARARARARARLTLIDSSRASARDADVLRVRAIMLAGFEEYRAFALPSSALEESADDVARSIAKGGAIVASEMGDDDDDRDRDDAARDVASVRFEVPEDARADVVLAWNGQAFAPRAGALTFLRLAVVPAARGRSLGKTIILRLEELARALGLDAVTITVRSQQPDNRPYYEALGYVVTGYGERYGVADIVTKMRKTVR